MGMTTDDMITILYNMDAALSGDETAEKAASEAAERIYAREPESEAKLPVETFTSEVAH